MKIPFVDLHAQYLTIKSEIDAAIADVIAQSAYIRSPQVDRFERAFAEFTGVPLCISCANGTDALYIAMRALGIQPGDEVITTAHSWIATSETITQAGGRVVFCDTDPYTFTIDPKQIAAKITPKTVGIIPVHLYGQPANMQEICALADKHHLWIVEDCAQAHAAKIGNRMIGSFGQAATYSFYPGKNLGAYGDAGAITTATPALAEWMATFARHGGKGDHVMEGINSRLDGLQAAVLSVKLPHLFKWTAQRQQIARWYDEALAGVGDLVTPHVAPGNTHVYHLYVVKSRQRDRLRDHLTKHGVTTVLNYPKALPFYPAYQYLKHRPEDFPVAYQHQSEILSLPIYPEMPESMVHFVVDAIKAFFDVRQT